MAWLADVTARPLVGRVFSVLVGACQSGTAWAGGVSRRGCGGYGSVSIDIIISESVTTPRAIGLLLVELDGPDAQTDNTACGSSALSAAQHGVELKLVAGGAVEQLEAELVRSGREAGHIERVGERPVVLRRE